MGDNVKKSLLPNESDTKEADPKWWEKIPTVTEVAGQRIQLSDCTYFPDDHLLKLPGSATDAEKNLINRGKAA